MISDDIILFCHIVLFYTFALSPLVTDYYLKKIILILIMFFCIQYVTKYGKCGIINIEKFFLKEKFKEGFMYRLIKPIICYKKNIVYKNYFMLIIIYMLVLYIQLEKANCNLNIFKDLSNMYQDIKKIKMRKI
jgi:hypothetical protein